MDVKFVHTTAAKVNSLPIVNGQVIALLDRDAYFYDLNGKRHPVTGLKFCGAKLPEYAGSPDTFYVVMPLTGSTEENRDLPGIYLWDPNKQGENATGAYVPIPSISNVVTTGEEDGNAITGISFDGVTATITKGKFTTYSDFQAHVDPNNKNPHGITAADLGLQNAITRPESELEVATAKKLAQKRTIQLSGDATGSAEFDGSDNASIQVNLKEITGVSGTHGPSDDQTLGSTSTFAIPYFTVDSNGRITAAGNRTMTINLDLGSADKLSTSHNIDGAAFDGTQDVIHHFECQTAGDAPTKVVELEGLSLVVGTVLYVKFANANTAANATLQLNDNAPKYITYKGANIGADTLTAGTYGLVYDGTTWQIMQSPTDPDMAKGDGFTYHGTGNVSDWTSINTLANTGFNSGHNRVKITLVGNIGSTSDASSLNLNIASGKLLELECSNAKLQCSGSIYNGACSGSVKINGLTFSKVASLYVPLYFDSIAKLYMENCVIEGSTYTGASVAVISGIFIMQHCTVGGSNYTTLSLGSNCIASLKDNVFDAGVTIAVLNKSNFEFSSNIVDDSCTVVYNSGTTAYALNMTYNNIVV